MSSENDNATKEKKWKYFYDTYYRYAYKIANNAIHNCLEIEDILQDTFISLWLYLDHITDDAAAKAWIFTVTHNKTANLKKKKHHDSFVEIDSLSEYTEPENDPLEIVVNQMSVELVYNQIKKMDKKYSEVLLLYFKFHYPTDIIAKLLNRKQKTVYTQLLRGKKELRKLLQSTKGGSNSAQ